MKSGYFNELENDEKMAASPYNAVITYDEVQLKRKKLSNTLLQILLKQSKKVMKVNLIAKQTLELKEHF